MKITLSDLSTPLFFQFFDDEYRDYVADVWMLLETIFEERMQNITYDYIVVQAQKYNPKKEEIWKDSDFTPIHCFNILQKFKEYPSLQENLHLYNSIEKISWNTFACLIRDRILNWNETEGMFVFQSLFSGKFGFDLFTQRMVHDINHHPLWRKIREEQLG